MAAAIQRGLGGLRILICALIFNVISFSTTLGHSGVLSRLYKKVGERNRPVLLVLDNPAPNQDKESYRGVSEEVHYHQKALPYVYLQKLLEGPSHSKSLKPKNYYDFQKPRLYNRKYRHRSNRDDNDRRVRYLEDDREDDRQDYRHDYKQGKRYDDRQDDREDRGVQNQNRNNIYSEDRDRNQQDDERKDRYRNRDREDRKYRSRYYKRTKLRTQDQGQDKQGNQQDRRGQDQDKKAQDQDRKRINSPSAQIPIVKSLLRSLNCEARDECEETCNDNNNDGCEEKCEEKFECNDEVKEDQCGDDDNTGSTKGEILVTEKPGCKRC